MIRLAIIGMGWAGERQLAAIRELDRKVEPVCLVDSDAGHLKLVATAAGISRTYVDYREALKDPDVDAVSICLPHALHAPVAIEAALAGKHILCEKPIALTVEDATRMIDTAEQQDVKLFVAENFCYTPQARFLREVVKNGTFIGEVITAALVWGFRAENFGYAGRRAWLTLPEQGGTGTWMLHGIHTMAQVRAIFGEVDTVYLREHHARAFQRPDIEGTMSGLLTLENGMNITLLQSCEIDLSGSHRGYTLYGERGILRSSQVEYQVFSDQERAEVRPYPEAALSEYALEIEAFADYVAGDDTMPTTGRSERRSLAIVQAGYESSRSGQPVNLKARFGRL